MTLWIDGDFAAPDRPVCPHDDRSYLYGDGLFETMRAYGGRLFQATRHAERLRRSAQTLGMAIAASAAELAARFQTVATAESAKAPGEDLYVRATFSRGSGGGPDITAPFTPRLLILARPLPPFPAALYNQGVAVVFAPERRSSQSTLGQHKTTSYLESLQARQAATARGAREALLLDTDGWVLEGACSNLFVVRGGELHTPPARQNLLPGIVRQSLLELALQCGLRPREKRLRPGDLVESAEVFLTNSLQELVPVVAVDGETIGTGAPGPATQTLHHAYREEIALECGGGER